MSCRTKQLNTNTRAWAANVAGSQFALHFCVSSPDHPHRFHLTSRIRRKDHVTVPPDFLDLQAFLLRFARFRAASHARHSEKIFPLNPRTTPIFFRHTRQRITLFAMTVCKLLSLVIKTLWPSQSIRLPRFRKKPGFGVQKTHLAYDSLIGVLPNRRHVILF